MKVLHDYDGAFTDIKSRCRSYLDTLIQLDFLAGVEPIIGIKNTVFDDFPDIDRRIKERYGHLDIRIHVHVIEDFGNELRTRHWIPTLNVPKRLWRYDTELFRNNNLILLNKGEFPIVHVDYPDYLKDYIELLWKVKFEGLELYKSEVSEDHSAEDPHFDQ